jgi:hypothetical protein
MIRAIGHEELALIREWAWVLPNEKLGSAQDTMKAGNLTPRQWVTVYELAANAANCATDALEEYFKFQPEVADSNSDTVIWMTARLLDALGQDVESIGGPPFLKRLGKIINMRNKSLHRGSILGEVGTQEIAATALADAATYVQFVRTGLTKLLNLDQQGRPRP